MTLFSVVSRYIPFEAPFERVNTFRTKEKAIAYMKEEIKRLGKDYEIKVIKE